MDIPAIFRSYSAAISSDIDRNRPEPMGKCISGSLNSKKPWRTVRLSENSIQKEVPALKKWMHNLHYKGIPFIKMKQMPVFT